MAFTIEDLELQPWCGRAILLVDLDAFFASVEQLDHPGWRHKPVIVGGDPLKHGVVSACSYEARACGVRAAMPSSRAKELCPEAFWSEGHFGRYREISRMAMEILNDETCYVQQVSIDEAFMDVTSNRLNSEHPALIAARIQQRIDDIGITCSIGVGCSKSTAKVASEVDKPHGITIIYPGTEKSFLAPLPIRALSGVGAASESMLKEFGIKTLGDMACADESILRKVFGKNAEMMRARACGQDTDEVVSSDEVKSVSHEVTFARDLTTRDEIQAAIDTLATKVARRLRRKNLKGNVITLKIRYDNRSTRTTQTQAARPLDDEFALKKELHRLLGDLWCEGMAVRLAGVAVSGFENEQSAIQETLFDDASLFDDDEESDKNNTVDEEKRRKLLVASDKLKDKFGEDAVRFGYEMKNEGNTTGTAAKNPADYL